MQPCEDSGRVSPKSELVYREIQFHLDHFSELSPGQCSAEFQAWNCLLFLGATHDLAVRKAISTSSC